MKQHDDRELYFTIMDGDLTLSPSAKGVDCSICLVGFGSPACHRLRTKTLACQVTIDAIRWKVADTEPFVECGDTVREPAMPFIDKAIKEVEWDAKYEIFERHYPLIKWAVVAGLLGLVWLVSL
ncbi:MAG: hypothetical protein ACRDBQ_00735 [Shewanella sp.]